MHNPRRRRRNDGVVVVGLWHLGVVVSACLAELGHSVVAVDPDRRVVSRLKESSTPVFEPHLGRLIAKNVARRRLSFTSAFSAARNAEFLILAFDTPVSENDRPDLTKIHSALSDAAHYLEDGCVVVVSSQVPVGTCGSLRTLVRRRRPELKFDVACVPENLKLGEAVRTFMNPDMLVIGAERDEIFERVDRLYSAIKAPRYKTDVRTAEMIKHSINAYRATQISFSNEVGRLCDELGVDSQKVFEGMRLDSRIGKGTLMRAGLGFSGGTLARDVRVLQALAKRSGLRTSLLDGVMAVNETQAKVLIRILLKLYGKTKGLNIAVLGLTYKAGTSTVRRSGPLEVIHWLAKGGAKFRAYDPMAETRSLPAWARSHVSASAPEALSDADAAILMTPWPEFRDLDFAKAMGTMRRPVIIDAQNFLDGEELERKGFIYMGIGRGHDVKRAAHVVSGAEGSRLEA